jgi:predicted transcriptional regulator
LLMTTSQLESRLASLEAQVARLEEKLEQTRIAARIRKGLDQADRGEVVPAREALETLRNKYNIAPQ